MRVVCVSDTHGKEPGVPDGDILIHAGDLTMIGNFLQIAAAGRWLDELPHKHKVVIAGNHDWLFQKDIALAKMALGPQVTYLQDQEATVAGLKFYGSPWQPEFCDWAFNLPRAISLPACGVGSPNGLDVLVTHGPPRGILDRCRDGRLEGCDDLLAAVMTKKPKLHVFGHMHEAHGVLKNKYTTFINAAIGYRLEHKPIVFDL